MNRLELFYFLKKKGRLRGLFWADFLLVFLAMILFTGSSFGGEGEPGAFLNNPHAEFTGDVDSVVPFPALGKRNVPVKPAHTTVGKGVYKDIIVVKFIEGSDIRLRNNQLVSLAGNDLAQLRSLLAQNRILKLTPFFTRPEQELEDEKQRGQQMSGRELADLNQYYLVTIDKPRTDLGDLVDALPNPARFLASLTENGNCQQ